MKPLYTYIAGVTMYGAQDILPSLPQDTPLELVREPDNLYDSCAIAIHYQGIALGHLPTRAAERIAPLMDKGLTVAATLTRVKQEKRAYQGELSVSFNPKSVNPENISSAIKPESVLNVSKPVQDKTNWGRIAGIVLAILYLIVFLLRGCGPY